MSKELPFVLLMPEKVKHPIVISAPHVGTEFPPEVATHMRQDFVKFPQDADWYVHELYKDIAEQHGLPMIMARYSRYVVDLNRDPAGAPLYKDGRKETSVVPIKSFGDESLYQEGREPDRAEVQRRVAEYHKPYHDQIRALLDNMQEMYRHVLLYDAHSIKRLVPTIRPHPFPDMILGTNEGKAAAPGLVTTAFSRLKKTEYDVRRDEIFKGGFLTRSFGQPQHGRHALQLERSWDIYLSGEPPRLDSAKVKPLKRLLQQMFEDLIEELSRMNH